MIRAAVLGFPISHSLSPTLHKSAYDHLGISGEYSRIEMTAEDFTQFMRNLDRRQWNGFSLTMPLKETVLSLVDSIDPIALRINSGNTILISDSRMRVLSTDFTAFRRIFSQKSFTSVAIIGGGGTARAALGALDGLVPQIDVLIRSQLREPDLRACVLDSRVNFLPMDASIEKYELVVSTTPAGVTDQIAKRVIAPMGELFEVLYHPWPTALAGRWGEFGNPVITGHQLLVEQALDQIHLMTGIEFDYAKMRSHLLAVI